MKNDLKEGELIKCDDGISRKVVHINTAIKLGEKRFFTGRPCKYGHISERKVTGYICVACARQRQKVRHKHLMANNPEYRKKMNQYRSEKHKERYRTDPKYRMKCIENSRRYRKENKV